MTVATNHIELDGVLERHELPERTSLLLNNEGLRQISAALAAIKTCTDMLNHREAAAGEGQPTFCRQTTHGLLAAITCCAAVIDAQVGAMDTEGGLVLKGNDAQELDAKAFEVWHRSYRAKGGMQ